MGDCTRLDGRLTGDDVALALCEGVHVFMCVLSVKYSAGMTIIATGKGSSHKQGLQLICLDRVSGGENGG